MRFIVDTHSLVWFLEDSPKLGAKAKTILQAKDSLLVIPSIVLVEIRYLAAKGRVESSFPNILHLIEDDSRCTVYPLDIRVVSKIPTELNIHDGIIYSTALLYLEDEGEASIITQDKEIVRMEKVRTIW